MLDFAKLTIKVETIGVEQATRQAEQLAKAYSKAEKDVDRNASNLGRSITKFGGSKLGGGVEQQISKVLDSYKNLYKEMSKINTFSLGTGGKTFVSQVKAELDQFPKFMKELIRDTNVAFSKGFVDPNILAKNLHVMETALDRAKTRMRGIIAASTAATRGVEPGRGALYGAQTGIERDLADVFGSGTSIRTDIETRRELDAFKKENERMLAGMEEQRNEFLNRDSAAIKRHYDEQIKMREKYDDELTRKDVEMLNRVTRNHTAQQKQEERMRNRLLDVQERTNKEASDKDWRRLQEIEKQGVARTKKEEAILRRVGLHRLGRGSLEYEEAQYEKDLEKSGRIGKRLKTEKTISDQLKNQGVLGENIKKTKEGIVTVKGKIIERNNAINNTVGNMVRKLRDAFVIYMTIYGVYSLLRGGFTTWLDLVKEMVLQIDELRIQIVASSAMMTSLTEKATPPEDAYREWTSYFDWLYRASLAADRKVAASGKEIFKVAQETAYRGVIATTTEQVETLGRLTDTIKMVTRGIGHQEWQIYQEIRNLFLGSEARLMGAQLLQRFKQIDPLVQQNIARLQKMRQETGNLAPMFEYIAYLVRGMTVASEDFAATWDAFANTTRGAIQLLFYEGFGESYKQIIKTGWALLDIIYKNGQLTAAGVLLGKTLSIAWSGVSDLIDNFRKELEKDPARLALWATQFIETITMIARVFIHLAKAILIVAESLDYLFSKKYKNTITDALISVSNVITDILNKIGIEKMGDVEIKRYDKPERERTKLQKFRDELNKYLEDSKSEALGDYKGNLPFFAGLMDIKEHEVQSVLRKYTDMYLDFARTATRADESVWSKVINFQSQSLQRIKELGWEMRSNNVLMEYAAKYEEKLLEMRKKSIKALIEGVKLEYEEYLTGLMEPMQEEREKLRIEQEKAKRKWEIPPEIKAMDTYGALLSNNMMRSSMMAAHNIVNGCVEGGKFLINASLEVANNIIEGFRAATTPTGSPITGGMKSEYGMGSYIDQHYLRSIRPQTAKQLRDFEVLAEAIRELENKILTADNCGDAVAIAINRTLEARGGEAKLPRGGLGEGDIRKLAEAYNVPVFKKEDLTLELLKKLGIGTIIRMTRQPGDYGYEYGKSHAEMIAQRPYTTELGVASYTAGKGLKWKELTEEYIKRLPSQTMATNPFLEMSFYGTPLPRLDEMRKENEEMMKQLEDERKKVESAMQGMRRPDIEKKGWAQKYTDLNIKEREQALNIEKQIASMSSEILEGTNREYGFKKEILNIEDEILRMKFATREFSDSELQSLYQTLRLKQQELKERKEILIDRDKATRDLDREMTIMSKNVEYLNQFANINKDYLSADAIKLTNQIKMNSLMIDHEKQRKDLNKFVIQNADWLTKEQEESLKTNQVLKERVDIYNFLVEKKKEELSLGGVGEGLQLWAMERIPEIKTRTTEMVADIMKEMESTLSKGILAVIKNKGGEGIKELGEQLLDTLTERAINMLVQSLFDWIAGMIGQTTILIGASSQASVILAAGGMGAAANMVNGATAAAAILSGAEGGMSSVTAGVGKSGGGFGSILGSAFGLLGKAVSAAGRFFGFGSGAGSWTTGGTATASNLADWMGSYATFAEGGIVKKPIIGLIGEAGPEAVIPLNNTNMSAPSVYNTDMKIQLSHAPTYNYQPTEDDYRRDAEMIVRALDKELRTYTKNKARNFIRI